MSEMRNVSSNPHVRDNWTTRKIMMVVAASLLIPAGYGVYSFGLNDHVNSFRRKLCRNGIYL